MQSKIDNIGFYFHQRTSTYLYNFCAPTHWTLKFLPQMKTMVTQILLLCHLQIFIQGRVMLKKNDSVYFLEYFRDRILLSGHPITSLCPERHAIARAHASTCLNQFTCTKICTFK